MEESYGTTCEALILEKRKIRRNDIQICISQYYIMIDVLLLVLRWTIFCSKGRSGAEACTWKDVTGYPYVTKETLKVVGRF